MLRPIDQYFSQQESCLQFLRGYILKQDVHLTEEWKYGMPFYCYKGKMCCYLWVHKKYKQPYLGIVQGKLIQHPDLITEKRAKMKILLLDPSKDLPMDTIHLILTEVLASYRND